MTSSIMISTYYLQGETMKRIPHQLMELNSTLSGTGLVYSGSEKCETARFHWHHPAPTGTAFYSGNALAVKSETERREPYSSAKLRVAVFKTSIVIWQKITFRSGYRRSGPDDIIKRKFPELALMKKRAGFLAATFMPRYFAAASRTAYLSGVVLADDARLSNGRLAAGLYSVWTAAQLGKKLVLRDFIDDSWPRQQLATVLSSLPDVRAAVKATESIIPALPTIRRARP